MACKYTYGNQVYDSLDDLKAAVKNDLQRSADKENVQSRNTGKGNFLGYVRSENGVPFSSAGKGKPEGDGKDKAMRKVANAGFIGELSLDGTQGSSTLTSFFGSSTGDPSVNMDNKNPLQARIYDGSSTNYSIYNVSEIPDSNYPVILVRNNGSNASMFGWTRGVVMLARNGKLSGKPLKDKTKKEILDAHNVGARFVVGDMPGVDTQFIDYLNEIGATYKVYTTNSEGTEFDRSGSSGQSYRNMLKSNIVDNINQSNTAESIYSKLGKKTQSNSVDISNIKTAEGTYNRVANIKEAQDNDRIYSMETTSDLSYSNPWASFDRKGTIRTTSTSEAVKNYIDWLTTDKFKDVKPERREWILSKLKSGELKGKRIQYYAELKEPSHATALDYLINKYDWNTNPQQSNTAEQSSNVKGENISSTGSTFAKQLTNPGNNLTVEYKDNTFRNAEHAYQTWKSGTFDQAAFNSTAFIPRGNKPAYKNTNYATMVEILTAKLVQHPELIAGIDQRGGLAYIQNSTHIVKGDAYWESSGQNKFIEALADAYRAVKNTNDLPIQFRYNIPNANAVQKELKLPSDSRVLAVARIFKSIVDDVQKEDAYEGIVKPYLSKKTTDLVSKYFKGGFQHWAGKSPEHIAMHVKLSKDLNESMLNDYIKYLQDNGWKKGLEPYSGEIPYYAYSVPTSQGTSSQQSNTTQQPKTEAKITVEELFESNPELANSVYEVMGFEKGGDNYYEGNIKPEPDTIFVFGSNPEGRHGAGAAKIAVNQFGAKYGQGEGLQGNAYALPTKDLRIKENNGFKSISPKQITENIKKLYEVARQNPDKQFKIGYRNTTEKSLNGYTGLETLEMFNDAGIIPTNIIFSKEWINTGKLNNTNQITLQQKQEAQQKFQEYINTTGKQDIQGFKEFAGQSFTNVKSGAEAKITDAEVEAMTKALVEMYPEIEFGIENNPNFVDREGVFNQQTNIKEGVSEIFEQNLELANQVYEALGFTQENNTEAKKAKNIVSASFTGQGTTFEIEIKGERKDFLLTWNRNNANPTLWGNKKEDGSYTTTDAVPSKEDIQKLVDKYIPSKLLNLINEWTNASKLPAEKVLDAQAIIEAKINAEIAALEAQTSPQQKQHTIASTIFELEPDITKEKLRTIYDNYVALMNRRRKGKAVPYGTFESLLKTYQVYKHKDTYIFGNYDINTATFITRMNSSPSSKELLAEAIPNLVKNGLDFISFVPKDYADKLVRSGYTASISSFNYNFKGEEMNKFAVASNPNVFKKIFNKSYDNITSEEIEHYDHSQDLKYIPVEVNEELIEKAGKDASKILETYLNQFGIVVKDINEIKDKLNIDEVGFADILSKIAYVKDKKDLPPIAGEFIAYMMQYNPLVSDIIKELSQTDNYKNLEKSEYFKIIGGLISDDLQNKLENNYSKSLLSKLKQLIKNFFSLLNNTPIDLINKNIGIISNNILQQNKKLITASLYKPGAFGKPTKQVNIEEALKKDKFGANIIYKLSKQGFILTGSTALSEQGVILRPDENPLHDIDWVSPFSRKETEEKFLKFYPNAIKVRDIYGDGYITDSYLIAPEGYSISNYKADNFNGKIIINSYDVVDSKGNVVGTYRLQKQESNNQSKEVVVGIEGKVIDFFSYENYSGKNTNKPFNYKSKEGTIIQLANWKNIFEAKLNFARYKDIWDYNRFIPNENINQITPEQKQQAQQKFQEYINATGKQDIEGFKEFAAKQQNVFNQRSESTFQGYNVGELLDRIINDSTNLQLVNVAKYLKSLDFVTKLHIEEKEIDNLGENVTSFYEKYVISNVYINSKQIAENNESFEEVVLHELMHRYSAYVTIRKRVGAPVTETEEVFYNSMEAAYVIYIENGFQDLGLDEFIAMSITNKDVVKNLKSITIGKKTLYDKIVDYIATLFKPAQKSQSLYTFVARAIHNHFENIENDKIIEYYSPTNELKNQTIKEGENSKIIGQADIQARKVLIDAAFKNKPDLVSHEFAHHYIAWFRNTPLVQQGIKMYGSEEALVQAIGEQAVVQRGKAWSWWKKFVAWLLNSANDVSDLTKENLRDILTDAFLSRQDLNKQAGTEAGVTLAKNVAVLRGETYLWNANESKWEQFTESEVEISYSDNEMQRRMQEERAQVKNDPVIKPAWKNNKRAALENRLLNMHKAIALHPVNAQNLLAPVSTVITKGIVKKLGIRAKHETRGAVIDPLSNINASIAMVQGKQGVGIVANAINTKAALTGVDAKLTPMYPVQSPLSTDEKHTKLPINLRMLGIEKVNYADGTSAYSLGKLVDTFGNSIISNLSESLTQQVDNVKDPVAVELGYTLKTLGLTSYILTLGVPQEILAGLTAKGGVVTAWNDRVEENENLFHKGVTETDAYRNEYGQKETKTTKFEESNSTLKVEFIAGLLRKEGVPSKYIEIVKDNNNNVKGYLLKHEALDADKVSLDKYDAVKLLFYWELIDQARAYGNTIKALTADTKTHKSIDAAAQQQLLIDQQLAGIDSIVDKDDIAKVISSRTALKSNTKSVISPFFNMQRKYVEYFSKYFYTHDNGISSYLAANLKARYKLYSGDKLNRLISTAHNDFMIYLMTRMTAVNPNATSSLAKYNTKTAPLVEVDALLKHGEGLKMSAVNSIYNNLVLISKQPNLTTSRNYYYAQPTTLRNNSATELYQNITPEMARSLLDIFRFELGRVIKADVNVDNNTSIYLQNITSVDLIMFKDSAITTSAANNYIEIFEELRTLSPKLIQLFNSISLFQAGLNNSPYNLFKTLPITDLLSEDKSKSLVSNLATTIRTFDKLLPKKGVAYSAEADKRSDAIYNMVDDFLRWFDLQYGKIYVQPEAASKYNKASRLYKAFNSKEQKFILYVKNDEGGGTPLTSVSSLTKNYLSTVPYTYAPTTTAVTNSSVITNDTINEDAVVKQLESLGAFGDIIKAYVAAGGEIETLCS